MGDTNPGINIETIRARQAMQDRARLMNETPLDELTATFETADIVAVNAYQWTTFDSEQETSAPAASTTLIRAPLPLEFSGKYSDKTHLLTHNKAEYPEGVEDAIFADKIVAAYIARTRTQDPDRSAAAMDVVRSRRTVIALLGHVGISTARPVVKKSDKAGPQGQAT